MYTHIGNPLLLQRYVQSRNPFVDEEPELTSIKWRQRVVHVSPADIWIYALTSLRQTGWSLLALVQERITSNGNQGMFEIYDVSHMCICFNFFQSVVSVSEVLENECSRLVAD